MESLVVPGISDTKALSIPIIELNNEDFPTFGLPTIATFIISSDVCSASSINEVSSCFTKKIHYFI